MTARPLCRYCGKPIAKRTTHVKFVDELKLHMKSDTFIRYVIGHPMTKAEAQALVNEVVVSVKHTFNPWSSDHSEYVAEASLWDGESYVDEFFCNGSHAKLFAYSAAAGGRGTPEYWEAKGKVTT